MIIIILLIIITLIQLYLIYCFTFNMNFKNIIRGDQSQEYNKPDRVVVSLTTLPSRINKIGNVIKSIQNGTVKPDLIYINIPKFSLREKTKYIINDDIKNIPGVKLNFHNEDYGPLTKIFPTLQQETDPDTTIICIDDDTEYDTGMLEHLLLCSSYYPDKTICVKGWNYINLGFFALPIFSLQLNNKPQKVKVLQCYQGVLYKRKFFEDDFKNYINCKKCFTVDDILISKYLTKKGIDIISVPYKHTNKQIDFDEDDFSLSKTNITGNKWVKCINENLDTCQKR